METEYPMHCTERSRVQTSYGTRASPRLLDMDLRFPPAPRPTTAVLSSVRLMAPANKSFWASSATTFPAITSLPTREAATVLALSLHPPTRQGAAIVLR